MLNMMLVICIALVWMFRFAGDSKVWGLLSGLCTLITVLYCVFCNISLYSTMSDYRLNYPSITAKVVDDGHYVETSSKKHNYGGSSRTYYKPVYEYTQDGILHTYQEPHSHRSEVEVDEEVDLYFDKDQIISWYHLTSSVDELGMSDLFAFILMVEFLALNFVFHKPKEEV